MSFDRELHITYFAASLRQLPDAYNKLDTNRLTLVHFATHALDLLGVWDDAETCQRLGLNKKTIIEWIYGLQVDDDVYGGFKGGTFLGGSLVEPPPATYNHGHIAMTYTALCTLRTLGDNLSRIKKKNIIASLKGLQREDGSCQCLAVGSESDMRFLYCACAISHMLNDWSGVNVDKAVSFIRSCRSFDGAIGLVPGQEGHGGSTFCAVASLVIMEQLDQVMDKDWRKDLLRWCVHRQVGGLQGRPNKDEDTCYSYWIGGTLRLLGEDNLLDHDRLQAFVMKCQTRMGGFSKVIGVFPDLLHSFYSMAYLSLSQPFFNGDGNLSLKELNCTFGICQERAQLFGTLFP